MSGEGAPILAGTSLSCFTQCIKPHFVVLNGVFVANMVGQLHMQVASMRLTLLVNCMLASYSWGWGSAATLF